MQLIFPQAYKTRYIISDALDPYFKDPIIKCLKTAPFNLICDESNDKGDKFKLLSILVRFLDSSTELIVICHLEIIAITDFTATGIFSSLESVLEKLKIPMANLLSFTSDTCNVMKVEQGGVIAKLRTIQPRIIHVHCICHLVSLCTKSAVKILLLKFDNFLVDIIYRFQNSANRVVILQEYTEFCSAEFKGNLKHCETR